MIRGIQEQLDEVRRDLEEVEKLRPGDATVRIQALEKKLLHIYNSAGSSSRRSSLQKEVPMSHFNKLVTPIFPNHFFCLLRPPCLPLDLFEYFLLLFDFLQVDVH